MGLPRVIPTLLLHKNYFYKGKKFKNHKYLGDPINIIKIFNDFQCDEVIILDIDARSQNRVINPDTLKEISKYALMPFTIGGGISSLKDADLLFSLGAEKISICSNLYDSSYSLIESIKNKYGSQSIVSCIDVKRNIFGKYSIYENSGKKKINLDLKKHIKNLIQAGTGEILVTSINQEGTRNGADFNLLDILIENSNVTNIYSGGISSFQDISKIIDKYRVSLSIGADFVFYGKKEAVLINYLTQEQLKIIFDNFFTKI